MGDWIRWYNPRICVRSRAFGNCVLNDRTNLVPHPGDFTDDQNDIGRQTSDQHCDPDAQVMCRFVDGLARLNVTLSCESQDVIETWRGCIWPRATVIPHGC